MYKKHNFSYSGLFCFFCVLLILGTPSISVSQDKKVDMEVYSIEALKSDLLNDSLAFTIKGNSIPTYTVSERFSPFRVVIDVANATFKDGIATKGSPLPANKFVTLKISDVAVEDTKITRFEFTLADTHAYKVLRDDKNLKVNFNPASDTNPQSSAKAPATPTAPADSTLKDLLASSEKIAVDSGTTDVQPAPTGTKFDDAFAGYNKERISVDFFKIDLHNVFRLFREVSGVNILVDESVTGSLTLAMNDVPWDFALDVILNLKNLEKEERFNTIVIYPKDKGFIWPNRPSDNLSIEADTEILSQEELIIEESAAQSKETLLAKELLGKAKKEESKENIQKAVDLYTQAFDLWPENEKIANHLTILYLVNLQMNAKALYYAKKTLALNPDNNDAALYAAISSANMQRNQEATEYFTQSISHNPPAKEALSSFAAFSENIGQNDAALTLLKKLHANYGETLDSMVSVARIYDKQNRYKEANKQYSAILTSGYEMPPALRTYINQRLASQNN